MRLTLRTLLAYLDDTLPASEAKSMGEKLAESEPAQEVVERIKNVIRRRRLTVPPASSRIDANTLAEYLDNEISPDLAEELERICLSSDVHLAEVSSCHQVLSLILGEPPAAPEQAVKRMYALAKGETPGPVKKAAKPAAVEKPAATQREADDALRMGLPSVFVKDWANRAMIFALGAVACLVIVVGAMQLLKQPDDPNNSNKTGEQQVAQNDKNAGKSDDKALETIKVAPKPEPSPEPKPGVLLPPKIDDKKDDKIDGKKPEVKIEPKPVVPLSPKIDDKKPAAKEDELPPPAFGTVVDQKVDEAMAALPNDPPSTKVVTIGTLAEPAKGQTPVVLQQLPKFNDWKRLTTKSEVFTARPIVALPGSKASIITSKGVKVTPWGNIFEQNPSPPVNESLVIFHENSTLDLDLTLLRGRILVSSNRNEPVVVRIRFEADNDPKSSESSWLLRLSGTNPEALIDRWSILPPGEPAHSEKDDSPRKGPSLNLACLALSGTVLLKTPTEAVTLRPAPDTNLALSLGSGKKLLTMSQAALPWLDAKYTGPTEFVKVRNEINNAFTGKAADVAIAELLRVNDPLTRRSAVRILGAIDDLPGLLDALAQESVDQRFAAAQTLGYWIALSPDNDRKLYDIVKQRLKANEPEIFMTLLHGFSPQMLSQPPTYELLIEYLKHRQIEIRELAAKNLYINVPAGSNIPYDAADPAKREKGYQMWLKLIPPGKLPPAAKKTAANARPPSMMADRNEPEIRAMAPLGRFDLANSLALCRKSFLG
jgi:hypothetical protein